MGLQMYSMRVSPPQRPKDLLQRDQPDPQFTARATQKFARFIIVQSVSGPIGKLCASDRLALVVLEMPSFTST